MWEDAGWSLAWSNVSGRPMEFSHFSGFPSRLMVSRRLVSYGPCPLWLDCWSKNIRLEITISPNLNFWHIYFVYDIFVIRVVAMVVMSKVDRLIYFKKINYCTTHDFILSYHSLSSFFTITYHQITICVTTLFFFTRQKTLHENKKKIWYFKCCHWINIIPVVSII